MNNSKKNNIKKVGGVFILLITVVLVIIFSQSNNVVEDDSSTTFSFKEEGIESVVVLNREDILNNNSLIDMTDKKKSYLDMKNEVNILKEQNKERYENLMRLAVEKSLKEKEEKRKKQLASRGSSNVKRELHVTATAYTSRCKGCTGITKSGYDVRNTVYYNDQRVVAMDLNIVPLHSIVKVYPNDREPFLATVIDSGGAIKGAKLDFLISTHDTNIANKFGRQHNVKVEVLREGDGK